MIEKIKEAFDKYILMDKRIKELEKRIEKLEQIHFGTETHPAGICPQCGNHTIRHEIRCCDERYISDTHYVHKQTEWLVCSACPYEKGTESVECHTEQPVTNNPAKIDWEAAIRSVTRD